MLFSIVKNKKIFIKLSIYLFSILYATNIDAVTNKPLDKKNSKKYTIEKNKLDNNKNPNYLFSSMLYVNNINAVINKPLNKKKSKKHITENKLNNNKNSNDKQNKIISNNNNPNDNKTPNNNKNSNKLCNKNHCDKIPLFVNSFLGVTGLITSFNHNEIKERNIENLDIPDKVELIEQEFRYKDRYELTFFTDHNEVRANLLLFPSIYYSLANTLSFPVLISSLFPFSEVTLTLLISSSTLSNATPLLTSISFQSLPSAISESLSSSLILPFNLSLSSSQLTLSLLNSISSITSGSSLLSSMIPLIFSSSAITELTSFTLSSLLSSSASTLTYPLLFSSISASSFAIPAIISSLSTSAFSILSTPSLFLGALSEFDSISSSLANISYPILFSISSISYIPSFIPSVTSYSLISSSGSSSISSIIPIISSISSIVPGSIPSSISSSSLPSSSSTILFSPSLLPLPSSLSLLSSVIPLTIVAHLSSLIPIDSFRNIVSSSLSSISFAPLLLSGASILFSSFLPSLTSSLAFSTISSLSSLSNFIPLLFSSSSISTLIPISIGLSLSSSSILSSPLLLSSIPSSLLGLSSTPSSSINLISSSLNLSSLVYLSSLPVFISYSIAPLIIVPSMSSSTSSILNSSSILFSSLANPLLSSSSTISSLLNSLNLSLSTVVLSLNISSNSSLITNLLSSSSLLPVISSTSILFSATTSLFISSFLFLDSSYASLFSSALPIISSISSIIPGTIPSIILGIPSSSSAILSSPLLSSSIPASLLGLLAAPSAALAIISATSLLSSLASSSSSVIFSFPISLLSSISIINTPSSIPFSLSFISINSIGSIELYATLISLIFTPSSLIFTPLLTSSALPSSLISLSSNPISDSLSLSSGITSLISSGLTSLSAISSILSSIISPASSIISLTSSILSSLSGILASSSTYLSIPSSIPPLSSFSSSSSLSSIPLYLSSSLTSISTILSSTSSTALSLSSLTLFLPSLSSSLSLIPLSISSSLSGLSLLPLTSAYIGSSVLSSTIPSTLSGSVLFPLGISSSSSFPALSSSFTASGIFSGPLSLLSIPSTPSSSAGSISLSSSLPFYTSSISLAIPSIYSSLFIPIVSAIPVTASVGSSLTSASTSIASSSLLTIPNLSMLPGIWVNFVTMFLPFISVGGPFIPFISMGGFAGVNAAPGWSFDNSVNMWLSGFAPQTYMWSSVIGSNQFYSLSPFATSSSASQSVFFAPVSSSVPSFISNISLLPSELSSANYAFLASSSATLAYLPSIGSAAFMDVVEEVFLIVGEFIDWALAFPIEATSLVFGIGLTISSTLSYGMSSITTSSIFPISSLFVTLPSEVLFGIPSSFLSSIPTVTSSIPSSLPLSLSFGSSSLGMTSSLGSFLTVSGGLGFLPIGAVFWALRWFTHWLPPINIAVELIGAIGAIPVLSSIYSVTSSAPLSSAFLSSVLGSAPGVLSSVPISVSLAPFSSSSSYSAVPSFPSISIPSALSYPSGLLALFSGLPLNISIDVLGLTLGSFLSLTPSGISGISFFGSNLLFSVLPSSISALNPSYHSLGISSWAIPFASISSSLTSLSAIPSTILGSSSLMPSFSFNPIVWSSLSSSSIIPSSISLPAILSAPFASVSSSATYSSSLSSGIFAAPSLTSDLSRSTTLSSQSFVIPTLTSSIGFSISPSSLVSGLSTLSSFIPGVSLSSSSLSTSSLLLPSILAYVPLSISGNSSSSANISSYSAISISDSTSLNVSSSFGINALPSSLITLPLSWSEISFNISNPFTFPGSIYIPYASVSLDPFIPVLSSFNTTILSSFALTLLGVPSILSSPVFPPSSSITSSYYSSIPFSVSSSQLPFSPLWSSFAIESSSSTVSSSNPSLSSNLPLIPGELFSINSAFSSSSSGYAIPSGFSGFIAANISLYSIGKIVQSTTSAIGSAIAWVSAGALSTLFNPSVMVTLSSSSINSLPSYNMAIIAIIAGSSLPSWNTIGSASLLFSSIGPSLLSTPSGWSAFPLLSLPGSASAPFWFSVGGGIPLISLMTSIGPVTLSLITLSLPIHLSASIPGSSTNWSLVSSSATWLTSYLNNLSFSFFYSSIASLSEIQSSSQFSLLLPSAASSSLPILSSQLIPFTSSIIIGSTLLPSSISSGVLPLASSFFAIPLLSSGSSALIGLFTSIPVSLSGIFSIPIYSLTTLSFGLSMLSSSFGGFTAPSISAISSSSSIFDSSSLIILPSITSSSILFPSLPSIGSIDSIVNFISSLSSASSTPIASIPISIETIFLLFSTSALSSVLATSLSSTSSSFGLPLSTLSSLVTSITSIPSFSSLVGAPSLSSQLSIIAPSSVITGLSSLIYLSSSLFPINGTLSIISNLSGFATFLLASGSFTSSLTSIPLSLVSLVSFPFLIISGPFSISLNSSSSSSVLPFVTSSSVGSSISTIINTLLGSSSLLSSSTENISSALSIPSLSISIPALSANILSSIISSPSIPSVLPSLSAELPLLSSLAPLSSSSLPSLPISSIGVPLLSLSILPSSLPLIFTSTASAPITVPLSISSAPISISSAPITVPLSSSSAPISSSLAPSLPSSVSIVPQISSVAPSVLPLSLGVGVRLSGPSGMKIKTPKNYGYNSYVWKKSNDFEFANVVTFGDSLSDTGSFGRGSIYMADGNPFVFYNNLISLSMTGKITVPETFGGTNYAVSGAIVKKPTILDILSDPLSIGRRNIQDQINWYLDDNGGHANKNSIYLLWIGGNDMTGDIQKILINPFDWEKNLTSKHYFNDKPKIAGSYAQELADKGAGNIIVLNLPDPGIAPFTGVATISATIDSAFMLLEGTKLEWLNIGHYITGLQDKFLRDPRNLVGSPIGRADEYAIENNVNATKSFLPFIPDNLIRGTYELLMKAQRHFVQQWNNDLYERVQKVNGNVLFIDTFALVQELTNDPESYGIDSILVPESTLGYTSPNVDDGDKAYHGKDGRNYMYTDFHHLSGYTHAILAEYILSMLQAPGLITSLMKGLEIDEGARNNFISNQFKVYRNLNLPIGKWNMFATVFGGLYKNGRALFNRSFSTQSIGIGGMLRLSETKDIGVMVSLGYDNRKPSNNLSYQNINESLTLFGQHKKDNIWINGSIFIGKQQMSDIKRTIRLGKKIRSEKGSTNGSTLGFTTQIGYEIPFDIKSKCNCINYFINPYIGENLTTYQVSSYSEKDKNTTSMKFNSQKRTVNIVTTGVQFVGKNDKFNTNIDIAYNIINNKDHLSATGQAKNLGTTFTRLGDGLSKNKNYFSLIPSIEYNVNNNLMIYGNIEYNYNNSAKNTNLNTSIGIKGNF